MPQDALAILDQLRSWRAQDAPTHGGHVMSYVYDSGLADLDALAARAMALVQPVNGLDPTMFTSVAHMERDLITFARDLLGGDRTVVGTATSGGTESCLLAVKTARANHRGTDHPSILAPASVHAAFHKAAEYLGLALDLVPVGQDGQADPEAVIARMGPDTALVVLSAPSYPHGALDPIEQVAAAALARGIDCHVDACFGGWILPFWDGLPPWDLSVPGVTSLAADLHKYGYAPKGISVLLTKGAARQHGQYFATTDWPGYPVVNPTLLGSKSAAPLAAAWAITRHLGVSGYAALAESCKRSTAALAACIADIEGLTVVGSPAGPLLAVARDPGAGLGSGIDPHLWADRLAASGWHLQLQPGYRQPDGSWLPRTTHLTITPVTESVLPPLRAALVSCADEVRGVAGVDPQQVLAALGPAGAAGAEDDGVQRVLSAMGVTPGDGSLPKDMAPLLALVEALPREASGKLLIELLAGLVVPLDRDPGPKP
ncbi:aminotransferase class V-fold PLP-dependent enzyme [Paeniglutamicibacter psychrophenolicus]|uniref:Glutamate/tyrosine decarboxylase-like PLP-dependent enzyme n=1 Tax=Paeniglutamicibacter psychrophenolicus TaxID=257454 RepID=A0ABS4WG71_9MICC|nr:aminotransferase class V-fold PLP-dependent enzyme [Paeniglutamicibacter psychrophenolicus]MBP2375192.1 glutamate/tyrosine decarboxylase-like PLP-dependent enzyme [Paeniglutamicibacter psychrophenolicus]